MDLGKQTPVPLLRDDLDIFLGPSSSDGSPTYTLYDPMRDQYFKINWQEGLILRYLKRGQTFEALLKTLSEKTTLTLDSEDLLSLFYELDKMGLLNTPASFAVLDKEEGGGFNQPFRKLFYHRFPLLNPDPFLEKTLWIAKLFGSSPFLFVYFLLTLTGLGVLILQFDAYLATFNYFYNIEGFLAYAAAILGVKAIHEFSHAYVAKRYGIEVSEMGIALIVLWPVLYTDVTHGWAIHNRRQRLLITVSGVFSELIVAGISTLLWSITPSGVLQSTFFILSSVTWVTSLLVNLNPCMRFDGYYALSDLSGIDNLQPRATALAHALMRKYFYGAEIEDPEATWSSRKKRWVVFYAVCTFIYRFFVYTGIGLFFYAFFTKSLGLIICAGTLGRFFLLPILQEGKWIVENHQTLKKNRSLKITKGVLLLALLAFVLPLPYFGSFSTVTTAKEMQLLTVTHPGKVAGVAFKEGEFVEKGSYVINVELIEVLEKKALIEKEVAILKAKIQVLEAKADDEEEAPARIPEILADLSKKEAELATLEQTVLQSQLRTDISGNLFSLEEFVQEGTFVKEGEILGGVADFNTLYVIGFVPEKEIDQFEKGKEVSLNFYNEKNWRKGVVANVRPLRSKHLRFKQLASLYGGDLPVTEGKEGALLLAESFYEVEIELKDSRVKLGQTGYGQAYLGLRSRMMETVRYLITLFWKESRF